MMIGFAQIDGARAIAKLPKGVHKQVQLYHRKGMVYVPHSGGFVEVRHRELGTDAYTTGHPDVKLLEYDENVSGFRVEKHLNQDILRFR